MKRHRESERESDGVRFGAAYMAAVTSPRTMAVVISSVGNVAIYYRHFKCQVFLTRMKEKSKNIGQNRRYIGDISLIYRYIDDKTTHGTNTLVSGNFCILTDISIVMVDRGVRGSVWIDLSIIFNLNL